MTGRIQRHDDDKGQEGKEEGEEEEMKEEDNALCDHKPELVCRHINYGADQGND